MRAQSPNVLSILATVRTRPHPSLLPSLRPPRGRPILRPSGPRFHRSCGRPRPRAQDVWERVSGSDAALSQGRALAQDAMEQLGREEAEERAAAPCATGPSQAEPLSALKGHRLIAARRRGQEGDATARGTLLPGRDSGGRQACARSGPAPRSRNVVFITVESLGALYTDLYNSDARTMPFLSGLFNAAKQADTLQSCVLVPRLLSPMCARLRSHMREAAATHATTRASCSNPIYLAGRAMRSYSSGSTYAMRNLEPPPPRRPTALRRRA